MTRPVANASCAPVSDDQILAVLATGDGPGHLVRALFQDCTFEMLDRIGAEHGVARSVIRQAYARATRVYTAITRTSSGIPPIVEDARRF